MVGRTFCWSLLDATGAMIRGAALGLVCVSLVCPADLLATGPRASHVRRSAANSRSPQQTQQQKVLHALNRFTFGPRPGDEAEVQRMGLERWFQQQLNPQEIPDTELNLRLEGFPAMRLSQAELIERFPSPQRIRQYSNGVLEAPADPMERAIYADAAFRYEQKKAVAQNMVGSPSQQVGMGSGAASAMAPPAEGTRLEASTEAATPGKMAAGGKEEDLPVAPTSTEAVDAVLAMSPAERLAHLAALPPRQAKSFFDAVQGPRLLRLEGGLSRDQMEQVAAMRSPLRLVGEEAMSVRLLRDVYTQRQLQAVMTDFWLNHFNVYLQKNQNEPYLLPAYERETILPNALERFEDLLVATAKSPAMLVYLDNAESIGPNSKAAQRAGRAPVGRVGQAAGKAPRGINENYARELMELHTLGVNGGYTQNDVIEVAKCFTGWTVDRPANGAGFTFNANRHEPGPKTVLGHTIPEDGESEGLAVLHLLASSPATAHFISLELAQRFVSDTPPPALVDRMTAAYLHSDGQIGAVLTAMFHSPEFWSESVYRAKVKTPMEFVVSALRAGDAEVSRPLPLVQAMGRLGMPIYGMQTPNGYSWQADAWVSSNALLARMNFALALSGNRVQGTRLQWADLQGAHEVAGPGAHTGAVMEQRLEQVILGQPATPVTHQAVLEAASQANSLASAPEGVGPARHAGAAAAPGMGGELVRVGRKGDQGPPASNAQLAATAGLLLGSPDFQRR